MKISTIYDKYYPPYLLVRFNSGVILRVWSKSSKAFGYIEADKYKSKSADDNRQRKTINTVILELKSFAEKSELSKFDILRSKLEKLGDIGGVLRDRMLNWKDYDLWKEIETHPWFKDADPTSKAKKWYTDKIKVNPDYFYKGKLLTQGKLYMYDYDHPKYEDVLDFFDTQPLIISLGPIETSFGKRDLGVNMHLLPPKIRRIVMYKIFELYRSMYREQMFAKVQAPIAIEWKKIAKPLEQFGIAFAIRMYIPELRKNVIEFKYSDWKNAIFIESKGLSKVTFEGLIKKWQTFVKSRNDKRLNENWLKN